MAAAVHACGGACIVTADHGNADHMLEPDGSANTAHSLNPVPLILTVPGVSLRRVEVNGCPGAVYLDEQHRLFGVVALDITGDQITSINSIVLNRP